ncbi:hypothetical protein MCOR28_007690 [Pyricularia oryzae]|nr:hypothetical protein MCOR26_009671 [Pyricularia oryzae]KAI6338809.1 hypothetical protein MCOR28_007690 [Pyricularia oryzae]KAI6574575.1 hypothetical protein MCOR09_002184 [Pyricularia oryzae]
MDDSYGFMLDPSWHANTCLDSNFLDNVEGIQDSRSHSGALPGSNVDFNYGTFITELNNCEKEDLRSLGITTISGLEKSEDAAKQRDQQLADKFAKIDNTNTQILAMFEKLEVQSGESFNVLKEVKEMIKAVGSGLSQFNTMVVKYFNGEHGKNRQSK